MTNTPLLPSDSRYTCSATPRRAPAALNHNLRFITPDGQHDIKAIDDAITATFERTGDAAFAHRDTWAEADGEMALYEMRVLTRAAGLPTVSDQVHGKRASDITLIAAE